jgi:hypothetical protein
MENAVMNKVRSKVYNDAGEEGPIAKGIEKQTSKMSSEIFLWAALGSMAASLTLKIAGKKDTALFVGQWAAPFLVLGLYNKIVKVAGHDRNDRESGDGNGQEERHEG